jgi:metal-responsive CopG/Arc/MetJ family transcriptional regulator
LPLQKSKITISVAIDNIVYDEIEYMKKNIKYANRSNISNELLRLGLEALEA